MIRSAASLVALSLAAIAATAAFATGCAATSAEAPTETSADAVTSGFVQTVATAAGDVLADMRGLSLYTFDSDTTSESTCFDDCLVAWPAFLVPEGQQIAAPFGVTTRPDGAKQVTLEGHPLYFFFRDAARGDIKGDGLGGVWHLARPAAAQPAIVKTVSTAAGDVLADIRGLSLYTFDSDTTSESTCYDGCATVWPPLVVPADAALPQSFGLTTRRDGARQVTLLGKPLYFFARDQVEGDIKGDGLGGVWHLARPVAAELP